jgi:hypothetical protein
MLAVAVILVAVVELLATIASVRILNHPVPGRSTY